MKMSVAAYLRLINDTMEGILKNRYTIVDGREEFIRIGIYDSAGNEITCETNVLWSEVVWPDTSERFFTTEPQTEEED